VFVALFLALQLSVPLVMLAVRGGGADRPPSGELPLSWQMYTVVPPVGELVLTKRDGSTATFDAVSALGVVGSRMAYDRGVLKAGCRLDRRVASVSITIVGRERTAQC
jgi:hypothetical protein